MYNIYRCARLNSNYSSFMQYQQGLAVINTSAGGFLPDLHTEMIFNAFSQYIANNSLKIHFTSSKEEMQQLVTQLPKDSSSLLIVGGGDGTLHAALNCIDLKSTTLAVIPCGTMNHFAKVLSLPCDHPTLDVYKDAAQKSVDIGSLNNIRFLNHANIGLHPSFVKQRSTLVEQGWNKWIASTAALTHTIVFHPKHHLSISIESESYELDTSYVFMSVNAHHMRYGQPQKDPTYQGGILFHASTSASPKEVLRAYYHIMNHMSGTPPGGVTHRTIHPLTITYKSATLDVAMDGETYSFSSPITCRTLPNALQLLLPKSSSLCQQ